MKAKWHSISIPNKSFDDLKTIQKHIPIRASVPQVIEWLIKVGAERIIKEKVETNYENTCRIPK